MTAVRSSKFCGESAIRRRQHVLSTFPQLPATAEPTGTPARAKHYGADNDGGGHSALVSWLPINALLERKPYADIVAFNDLCMVRDIRLILNSYFDSAASVSSPEKKRSCSPDVSTRRDKRARIL